MRFPHQLMGLDSLRGVQTPFIMFIQGWHGICEISDVAEGNCLSRCQNIGGGIVAQQIHRKNVCVCAYVYYKAK